ncbi:MAG: gliding motility-associated C-terminal domain-containing protein [Chitinophagales bacterium]|jgi:gliding motility-associated-like protein|nr:gliding motility-associated C-terminal domain-containing protein [Sphingobacteriales bacterium]
MIKKLLSQTKNYTAFLCMVLYAWSSIAQDSSAIHGSLIVHEGEVRFDQGELELGTVSIADGYVIGTARQVPSYMSFMSTATWKGASATSYVDGYVRSYKTNAFIFPIGDNGVFRPVASSVASPVTPIDAAYFHADPSAAITSSIFGGSENVLPIGGPFPTSSKQVGIQTIDPTGYWHIKGTLPTRISLSWLPSTAMANFTANDLKNLTIVGWKNNQWHVIPSAVDVSSILGGSSNYTSGSITTSENIVPNDFVVLALGSRAIPKTRDTTIIVSNSDIKTIGPAAISDPNIDFRLSGPFRGSGTASIDPKTGLVSFTPVVPAFVGRDTIYKIRCVLVGSVIVCDTTRIFIEGRPNRTPVSESTNFNTGKVLADLPPISTGGKPFTTSTTSSAGSTVSIDANGKVNYIPRMNFFGTDTVRVSRCVDGVCDIVTYLIVVNPPLDTEIPNYFSPNGDGVNDVWNLDNLLILYPKASAIIYNRWGNIVWRSTGPYGLSTSGRNLWYGQLEGSQDNVPDGVYYYLLELEDKFKTTKTGFIELMRQ